jgi:hypothetical protein
VDGDEAFIRLMIYNSDESSRHKRYAEVILTAKPTILLMTIKQTQNHLGQAQRRMEARKTTA